MEHAYTRFGQNADFFTFAWKLQIATTEFKKFQNFLCNLYLWEHSVAYLIEALRYSPEGRDFDSRWVPGLFPGW